MTENSSNLDFPADVKENDDCKGMNKVDTTCLMDSENIRSFNSVSHPVAPNGNNDIVSSLNWNGNVGVLPGTDMKFRIDDAGEVEMVFDVLDTNENCDISFRSQLSVCKSSKSVLNFLDPAYNKIKTPEDFKDDSLNSSSNSQEQIHDYSVNNEQKNKSVVPSDSSHSVKDSSLHSENDSAVIGMATCEFCLKFANSRSFCGRFCSRQCLGKHAAKRRIESIRTCSGIKKSIKSQKLLDETYSLPYHRSDSNYNDEDGPRTRFSSLSVEKKKFSWKDYLSDSKAIAAPVEVFRNLSASDPFPRCSNNFEKTCLLEAVDPQNPSVISLVSITSIRGHRLHLHFEGFPPSYDFWTNADSHLIFPCGFCNKTGRSLSLPYGYDKENFNVNAYARQNKLKIAPSSVFAEKLYSNATGFEVGDRFEAVDRQNPELTCVAAVSDVIGLYVLVHFDGWEHSFDYWTLCTSNYIYPVGWCSENQKKLSPPPDFEKDCEFNWNKYLKSKNAKAADRSRFSYNPHGFQAKMKLEVVDPRNQILIRVASIVVTDEHRVKINFDGWSKDYDLWIDADNPDLHPIFWCDHTGEDLFTPVCYLQLMESDSKCPISGCLGHGHIRSDRFVSHHSAFGCPYSPQNRHRDPIPNRFTLERTVNDKTERGFSRKFEYIENLPAVGDFRRKKKDKKRRFCREDQQSSNDSTKIYFTRLFGGRDQSSSTKANHSTSLLSDLNHKYHHKAAQFSNCTIFSQRWEKHVLNLPGVKGKTSKEVKSWSTLQVSSFVNELTGKRDCGEHFVAQEIDGEAFLMLSQSDLSSVLKLKLGPSVKIFNAIMKIKGVDDS